MRHPGTLRNFASTVRLLAERGHTVRLFFTMQDKLGDGRAIAEIVRVHPGITVAEIAEKATWRLWLRLSRAARASTDYLRYLTPAYREATALRARAEVKTPAAFRRLCRLPLVRSRAGLKGLGWVLRQVERAIPSDRDTEALLRRERPDVVLVSPLVDFASDQVDMVKSARALGVPTGLCVHSWDNLTNKGLVRVLPDRVFVWNEYQQREAVEMHGVAESAVVITGAPTYDQWFDWRPSRSREEFCRIVGLRPDRPFLVYLCSSPFIAADEAEFVHAWLRRLRASVDPGLREVGVLVRPHPENIQPWHRFDFADFRNVVIWPREGTSPVDHGSKNDYFDSLSHSLAAVGLNTSALIEAGIVGKAVYTVRAPEYAGTQDGTLHFRYLVNVGGGLLQAAADFDTHLAQLARAVSGADARSAAREFVRAFVRPHGLDQPATPRLVDAIEELGRQPRPRPAATPLWLLPLRAAMYPVAISLRTVRDIERVSRKRERALRPVTTSTFLGQVAALPLELLLRWRPSKRFIKKHITPRLAPRGADADLVAEEAVAVERYAQKLARSERRIIVGPWLSEVGLELLYWIPFLNWFTTTYQIPRERIVVVSRGGAAPWYSHLGASYVDLYDFFTPDQVATRNTQGVIEGSDKLRVITEFDRQIVKLVQQSLQTRETSLLHPMQMCQLFGPFWRHLAPVGTVEQFSAMRPFAPPPDGDTPARLPARYVAVKVGFNPVFPDTDDHRRALRRLIEALADHLDVVMLDDGSAAGATEAIGVALPRVHRLAGVTPRNNLEQQSRVVSGAAALVGAFSGLSYLGALYGRRSVAIYGSAERLPGRHLELARRALGRLGRGSLMLLDVKDVDLAVAAVVASVREPSGTLEPSGGGIAVE